MKADHTVKWYGEFSDGTLERQFTDYEAALRRGTTRKPLLVMGILTLLLFFAAGWLNAHGSFFAQGIAMLAVVMMVCQSPFKWRVTAAVSLLMLILYFLLICPWMPISAPLEHFYFVLVPFLAFFILAAYSLRVHTEKRKQYINHRKLTDFSDHLEQQALFRSRELQTAYDANIRTAEENNAKIEYVSRMSRRLRKPLDTLERDVQAGNADDALVSSFSYFINAITEVSAMGGGSVVTYAETDMQKLLSRVRLLVAELAEEKQVSLAVRCHLGPNARYRADVRRLTHMLAYLAFNALEFTATGDEITLSADEVYGDSRQGVLRFSVADTGKGMSEEQVSHLFRVRGPSDGVIEFNRTGIGLTLVRQMAEQMNGRIWVESKPGKGTVFTFEISMEREGRE